MKKSDAELYKLMCMKMSSVFEKFEEVNNFNCPFATFMNKFVSFITVFRKNAVAGKRSIVLL